MNTTTIKNYKREKTELNKLTEEQRYQIFDWMLQKLTFPAVKTEIKKKFNIELKSIGPIEWFWKIEGAVVREWQLKRPPTVTALAWEAGRRKNDAGARDPKARPDQVRTCLTFLAIGPGRIENTPSGESSPPNSGGKRARKESEENKEEVNPLDDDEKLREVRIQVFGSAPE